MQATNLPQSLVSFHLRPLREGGILLTERKGSFIYYSVSDPRLIDLLSSLAGVRSGEDEGQQEGSCFPPIRFMQKWTDGGD